MLDVFQLLKEEQGFDLLVDITCVDYLHYRGATHRFGMVYLVANGDRRAADRPGAARRAGSDGAFARSVVGRQPTGWSGRSGTCSGSALRDIRICAGLCLPEQFTAHPLRKDYPLQGRGERHNFPFCAEAQG